jgi:2-keto-4-pentenoate hydratase/2-oxohepta-3-ene-1,7-dioic acid hydratase in catechol pathway
MRLTTFYVEDEIRLGIATERSVIDVAEAAVALGESDIARTPAEFFSVGLTALEGLGRLLRRSDGSERRWVLPQEGLRLGPCVPEPQKILCVGLNYLRHAEESGMSPPETPVLFSKFNNSLAGHGDEVPLPGAATEYDYEAELVVVMGRRARNVSEDEALSYVLGYCNGNDLSARDLQMRSSQWLLGKTLDRFLPLGPYLLTADEAASPQAWPVRCWLNGELRQDSSTADMIFSVAQVISYASRYMTLEPGDLICTGTPEGVILGMKDKTWLKPGDEVSIEIGPLGRLCNRMVAMAASPADAHAATAASVRRAGS